MRKIFAYSYLTQNTITNPLQYTIIKDILENFLNHMIPIKKLSRYSMSF